jgi:hypothetical protein
MPGVQYNHPIDGKVRAAESTALHSIRRSRHVPLRRSNRTSAATSAFPGTTIDKEFGQNKG